MLKILMANFERKEICQFDFSQAKSKWGAKFFQLGLDGPASPHLLWEADIIA